MYNILSITLKDFKSYVGETHFEFPVEPGLYFLTGKNLYTPRLGANGCGKSTIIDAIDWCHYGKTHRGLKAGDIISWGKKTSSITLKEVIGDEEYTITRTQSPNSLSINGEPASQDALNALLRINQEAFDTSIILPQFGNSFLDLTATQKLLMFAQVMDLDYWLEKSKEAAEHSAELLEGIKTAEREIAKLESVIESKRTSIRDLKTKQIDFDKEIDLKINKLLQRKKQEKTSLKKALIKERKAKKALKGAESTLEDSSSSQDEVKAEINDIECKLVELKTSLKLNKKSFNELDSELLHFSVLKDERCSNCDQIVSAQHVKKTIKPILKKHAALGSKIEADEKSIEEYTTDAEKLRLRLHKIKSKEKAISEEIYEKRQALKKAEQSYAIIENNIAYCNKEISKLKDTENPFLDLVNQERKKLKSSKKEVSELKKELIDWQKEHEAFSFWINGFKRVRLLVIEETIASLELEVNNHLMQVGLTDYRITFDIERENKSGSITKGFSVFIHSPRHDKPVRFESFGGGEIQRLRLAADLGLSSLILGQAGLHTKIEFVDEPSAHLSSEGIEDMVETLFYRAQEEKKAIWLVDHQVPQFGQFTGTLLVTMNENGASTLDYKGGEND